MTEPLFSSQVERKGLEKLNGWGADLGGCLIDADHYYIVPKPIVVGLPPAQKWTDVNQSKSDDLEDAASYFIEQGYINNTVLTLTSVSTTHIGLVDAHAERLWDEGNPDLGLMVEHGRSKEVNLFLSTCSYTELLAYITGRVEGLNNPNGVLVSLQVITSDNKFVLANRGRVSVGKNQIGVAAGGGYDTSTDEIPEPEGVAYHELKEELGVDRGEASVRLITLMEDKYKRPVLFYRARLELTSDQLKERWSAIPIEEQENSELYFLDYTLEGLMKFALEHSPDELHAPADLIFQYALLQKLAEEKAEVDYVLAGAMSTPL